MMEVIESGRTPQQPRASSAHGGGRAVAQVPDDRIGDRVPKLGPRHTHTHDTARDT